MIGIQSMGPLMLLRVQIPHGKVEVVTDMICGHSHQFISIGPQHKVPHVVPKIMGAQEMTRNIRETYQAVIAR